MGRRSNLRTHRLGDRLGIERGRDRTLRRFHESDREKTFERNDRYCGAQSEGPAHGSSQRLKVGSDPQKSSISKAHTLEEIADYWDSHSLDNHWDQTHEVEFEVGNRTFARAEARGST